MAACPDGDGLYCGGHGFEANVHVVYRCAAGELSISSVCAESCEPIASGGADRCKSSLAQAGGAAQSGTRAADSGGAGAAASATGVTRPAGTQTVSGSDAHAAAMSGGEGGRANAADGGHTSAGTRAGAAPTDTAGQTASSPANTPDAGMEQDKPTGPLTADSGLVAQYYAVDRDPHNTTISPGLRILNLGSQPVGLASLELRYYFTNEHAELCPRSCMVDGAYAGLVPSGAPTTAQRRYVQQQGARAYLSVRFPESSERLAHGEAVEVQQQIHTEPFLALDETDDYSFDAAHTSFAGWNRVTVYRDDALVWGEPPP